VTEPVPLQSDSSGDSWNVTLKARTGTASCRSIRNGTVTHGVVLDKQLAGGSGATRAPV
jgi:hypothetical protein